MTLPAIIETDRLVLRQPRLTDAPAIFDGYARDPGVTRYLAWRIHHTVAETEDFLARCIAAWAADFRRPWALTRRGDDSPVGMIEARVDGGRAELGYVLARHAWGQGLMTEAVRAVVDAALAAPAITRVWAMCDAENNASARVLEKAGLILEARLPRVAVHPNAAAAPRDVLLYGLGH